MTLLTIAGFDPSSGAGVTADLSVFAAWRHFGTACITALTVQSTRGVYSVHPVEPSELQESLEVLVEDLPPTGIKIGMLATEANVRVVVSLLESLHRQKLKVHVVLDPVLVSSSGKALLEASGAALLRERLLPLVDWVTPNLMELGVLANLAASPEGEAAAEDAVSIVQAAYPRLGVVATGGDQAEASDLVADADQRYAWMRGSRIESHSTHGTGCAFSSAMLCGLVEGLDAHAAALRAKTFVAEGIRRAVPRGNGTGPLNLLWPLSP